MAGRPTDYTPELADRVCELLVEGKSMRYISRMDGMPASATLFRWLREKEAFREQYAQAKVESAEAMAEDIIDIADDGTNDYMERMDEEGNAVGYKFNGEHVQRSKLRVDTRKWLMSKMMPKKYGDKQQVDHTSTDGSMAPPAPTYVIKGD